MSVQAKKRTDTQEFVALTVSRSMPDLHRPKMDTATEEKLLESDRRSAECYATMETMNRRISKITQAILSADEGVVAEPFDDSDSVVTAISELAKSAQSSSDPTRGQ